jgi:DnaJ-class molecular chaperone
VELEILCMRCDGSGWEDRSLVPLCQNRQVFVLTPCKLCAGKGKIEIKQEGSNGGGSRDLL